MSGYQVVTSSLLERDAPLAELLNVVTAPSTGRGAVALVTGEAGAGRTSVIRSLVTGMDKDVRILIGSCDQLSDPPALGPLREAYRGNAIAETLKAGVTQQALDALLNDLAGDRPTVLVVEDLQWADPASVDAIRYLARRLEQLSAALVLTMRSDVPDLGDSHRALLGELASCRARRIELKPLSLAAVGVLSQGSYWDPAELHSLTAGNPFYLTEVLADPAGGASARVAEAVIARLHLLGTDCLAVLEQLSVVPRAVDIAFAERLLGHQFSILGHLERCGVIAIRAGNVEFRREVERRAVERSIGRIRQIDLNRRALQAVLPDHPVGPAARARIRDEYARDLHRAQRLTEATELVHETVSLLEHEGESAALVESLVRLSQHLQMAGDNKGALTAVDRAAGLAEPMESETAQAVVSTYRGMLLAQTGQWHEALVVLGRARDLASAVGRTDLLTLCLAYLGTVRANSGDPRGVVQLRGGLRTALESGDADGAAAVYANLAEVLFLHARFDELGACLDEARRFTEKQGLRSLTSPLEVYRALHSMRSGDPHGAEWRLFRLLSASEGLGSVRLYSLPFYARLLARRGELEAAEPFLADSWREAWRQGSPIGILYSALARAEWAWLSGRADVAEEIRARVSTDALPQGLDHLVGEMYRYLFLAGASTEMIDGQAGSHYVAGPDQLPRILGDPYEEAISLICDGSPNAIRRAVSLLEKLGAVAAVRLVSKRPEKPTGRGEHTPDGAAIDASLTRRQREVLELLVQGLTNAEIARTLVVSVRTVDHHVSAILARLGVRSRQGAIATAKAVGLTPMAGRARGTTAHTLTASMTVVGPSPGRRVPAA
ncbi:AAA family ATPase [Kribbella sp. NPDC023855]|uniref:AAA family ATPase n=1 Tax=Kribbella sp. NPDC023855 TaxID=3154698 RepID=UPI0033E9B9C9